MSLGSVSDFPCATDGKTEDKREAGISSGSHQTLVGLQGPDPGFLPPFLGSSHSLDCLGQNKRLQCIQELPPILSSWVASHPAVCFPSPGLALADARAPCWMASGSDSGSTDGRSQAAWLQGDPHLTRRQLGEQRNVGKQ